MAGRARVNRSFWIQARANRPVVSRARKNGSFAVFAPKIRGRVSGEKVKPLKANRLTEILVRRYTGEG
jgi:hypothetical protein